MMSTNILGSYGEVSKIYIAKYPPYPFYSQGPKVFPQCLNFYTLQCIFMFTRKFSMLLLDNQHILMLLVSFKS